MDYVNVHIANEPPLLIPTRRVKNAQWTVEEMKSLIDQRRALLGRLWQLSPIPVPGPANTTTISADVAHDRYLNFVKTYATDSILPLFQQRYSRILLKEYHWLESGQADVIAYYINQLLISQSTDTHTITSGLVALNGHLPRGQFRLLLNRALPVVDKRLAQEKYELSGLIRLRQQYQEHKTPCIQEAQRRAFSLTRAQQQLPEIRNTYVRDSSSLVRLLALKDN